MSTKEEHLKEIERDEERECREFAGVRVDALIEQLAEARAERDAAEEDSRLTLEEHLRVVRQRDDAHDELEQARNRIEFLENGAAPVDAAQPAEDVAPKLREALALSLGADPSRPIWALVNEAIGRIRFLEVAAQPESAPGVGGVAELMLDEIQHLVDQYPYCPGVDEKVSAWLTSARAAIRAQKRVDVEALRDLGATLTDSRERRAMSGMDIGRTILRAIGDVPPDATSAPQGEVPLESFVDQTRETFPDAEPEPPAPAEIPGYVDTRGLFAKYIVQRTDGSDAPGGKHHGCWYFVLDCAHDPHARVALAAYAADCATMRPELARDLRAKLAEFQVAPPAPAEAEGPFTDNGGFGWICDNGVAALKAISEEAAERYTRKLNLGHAAEQLGARLQSVSGPDDQRGYEAVAEECAPYDADRQRLRAALAAKDRAFCTAPLHGLKPEFFAFCEIEGESPEIQFFESAEEASKAADEYLERAEELLCSEWLTEEPEIAYGRIYARCETHRGPAPEDADYDETWSMEMISRMTAEAENERLRARVAELERNVEIATTNGLRATQAHNRELARADLAEAKLAERERQIDSMQEASASFVRERDELKAKLAALGENPIRRGLVMRHLDASEYESVDLTLNAILAGREPGVAS